MAIKSRLGLEEYRHAQSGMTAHYEYNEEGLTVGALLRGNATGH
jgi:hypothetical protein